MRKLSVSLAVCFFVAITVASATAHREMRAGYGSGPGNVEDIAEERGLDLTAEQRDKINTLRRVHLRDIEPLQERLHVKTRELRGLWLAETPNRENILALQKEVQDLRNRLMDKLTAYRLDAWQLLTPEQQEKIRPHGPWGRHQRMGGPGMGRDHEQGRGTRGPFGPPPGAAP